MYTLRMNGSNLISAAEFLELLGRPNLRVVDARFELLDPAFGLQEYAAGHVPGAVHLDLDADLSSAPARHGGRHPLPDMAAFARRLGELGISRKNEVVVYDQSGAMYAARAWWLLRYAGHHNVRYLDGGLAAYLEAGGELTNEPTQNESTTFELHLQPRMVVDADYVRTAASDSAALVLDARAGERYRGEIEPLDPKAGHIPGAVNRYYQDALQNGRFKDAAGLRAFLAPALEAGEVIAYCGSGVSAAHLLLALEEAGVRDARLYAGSWSDWSSYDHLPVATGEEE